MPTRERIFEVALRLFADRGYDAVGVAELASASETTKPTLYHHFGNKLGVLDALLAEHFEPWLERLAEASSYRGDLPQTLFRVVQSFFALAKAEPQFVRLQWSLWLAPPDSTAHQAVSPYLRRQHRLLEKLFESAVPEHGNLRGHQSSYVIALTGMLGAYVTAAPRLGHSLDPDAAHLLCKQFMYGIYAL